MEVDVEILPFFFFFLKKSALENHQLWVFHKRHKTDNCHERTCKELMVTKAGF
jgi:hypothetical protein